MLLALRHKNQFERICIAMSRFQSKKKRHAVILAMILLLTMTLISQTPWMASFELKTVDLRTHWLRKNLSAPDDIVLILIDEASLDSMQTLFGRWPWHRRAFADVIQFLSDCGAKAILIDVLFTEKELLEAADESLTADDRALVASTLSAQTVYHSAQFTTNSKDEYNHLALNRPLPARFVQKFAHKALKRRTLTMANTYYLPFEELYLASKGIGVVSISPDSDGVYRRIDPFIQYGPNLFPILSLAPFLADFQLKLNQNGNVTITLPDSQVKRLLRLDSTHKYFINMYGKFNTYSFSGVYLSLVKIGQGTLTDLPISPEVFLGKTIFIGASAAGVEDLKHTAIGTQTPGVYLHASAFGNIATNDFLTFTPKIVAPMVMAVMVVLTVMAFFFLEGFFLKIMLPFLVIIIWELISLLLFTHNLALPMGGPLLAVFSADVVSLSFLSVTQGRERRKIKNVLGQYVSPSVLSKVLENPTEEFMRAEVGSKEELSVFFSDIRGFTTFAECYPVEKVVELLNSYLSAMTNIIFEKNGTLDKFIGDAIVAFWGAPLRDDKHPIRAVQSALEMQTALKHLNRENRHRNLPRLSVGIGIHTDHVILGNIGSHRKLDYTIIGDGVNLASRLEGLTKMYNTPILISQTTYDRVMDDICCRIVDYVKVKGKRKAIRIYSVMGMPSNLGSDTAEIIHLTEKAFDKYASKDFKRAEEILIQILAIKPKDYLATLLLFRCKEYQLHPPADEWDGYYEYQTK